MHPTLQKFKDNYPHKKIIGRVHNGFPLKLSWFSSFPFLFINDLLVRFGDRGRSHIAKIRMMIK